MAYSKYEAERRSKTCEAIIELAQIITEETEGKTIKIVPVREDDRKEDDADEAD